jgi:hypothetical protein
MSDVTGFVYHRMESLAAIGKVSGNKEIEVKITKIAKSLRSQTNFFLFITSDSKQSSNT